MNNNNQALADLLFPEYAEGAEPLLLPEDYEEKFPERSLPEGAAVTRLGPSPTGFIHLGNLFTAVVNLRLAKQSGGVCFLRIEDTDQKREVDGAVEALLDSLAYFGVCFDEGVAAAEDGSGVGDDLPVDYDRISEKGFYGPYRQSDRVKIYRAFARRLVLEGKAYPCFLTENEIEGIRAKQEAFKELPGIYGNYAEWRGADLFMIEDYIVKDKPYVIRFFADHESCEGCDEEETIIVRDGIRGGLSMPKNIMDVVLLKRDGLPTYHFAHVIDDHLMRTTHVVRGEEWLPSLPIHIALFSALGFETPCYCHTALLMKLDTGTGVKRKLSKRKDPEFALSYYIKEGYFPLAVEEYLLTIINSNYEEWRLANPFADNESFIVETEKMGSSGILFDIEKLRSISRERLAGMPADQIADFVLKWADENRPEVFPVLYENKDMLTAAIDVGRSGEKPRKDLVCASQILEFVSYFFDLLFCIEDPLPDNIGRDEARRLLEAYLGVYDHGDDRTAWFEKIRDLSKTHGYAPKPKEYKDNPDMYKGHVGDVSTVIRLALTGRRNSPDIYEIQQILGKARVLGRLNAAIVSE